MGETIDAEPLPPRRSRRRLEPGAEGSRAAELIPRAERPDRARRQRRRPHRRRRRAARLRPVTGIGVAETFMGKGVLDYEDPRTARHRRPAVARLRAGRLRGRRRGDHGRLRPRRARARNWNPRRNKRIVCIDTVPPEVDEHFITEVDLVGDLYHILGGWPGAAGPPRAPVQDVAPRRHRARPLRGRQGRRLVPDAAAARAVGDPRRSARRRHADLRRRAAQAVDRAHVPGARARTRCSSPTASPAWASRCRRRSPPSSSTPTATSSRSTATAASS